MSVLSVCERLGFGMDYSVRNMLWDIQDAKCKTSPGAISCYSDPVK